MSTSRLEVEPLIVDPESQPWERFGTREVREDEPNQRTALICDTVFRNRSFSTLVFMLNRSFTERHPMGGSVAGNIIGKSTLPNGLITTMGLDYRDLESRVFPRIAVLGREMGESSLDQDVRLRRLADMAAVVIAQAQSFTVGNKRTARATYGWVSEGVEGIIKGHNSVMDLEPPQEIEDLILNQNLTRLRELKQGDAYPYTLGGRYVDPGINESLESARSSLEVIRSRYDDSIVKGFEIDNWNMFKLGEDLESRVNDAKLRKKMLVIMFQEKYGPAALSLVSDAKDIFSVIDTDFAECLIAVNDKLLEMRVISLATGLANGGNFTAIEDTSSIDKARQYRNIHWEPSIVSPRE